MLRRTSRRRFKVALSFPGEQRTFVERVANDLASVMSRQRVLYDKYHEIEFARLDLDVYLPRLYREDAELIVVFLCPEYKAKRWCGLEWRHIRQNIGGPEASRVMFLSFGDPGDLSELGILKGDGYLNITRRTPQEVAENIRERLLMGKRKRRSSSGSSKHTGGDIDSPSPAMSFADASWLEHVRNYAPAQGLADRETELSALATFCAGTKTYAWWQGNPWAGKTALLAWFVLHPPINIIPVCFFVTGRLVGHDDSSAFTSSVLEQLTNILGSPPTAGRPIGDQTHQLTSMLAQAARVCKAQGLTLVLAVDGLDEDHSGARLPSIASLLPKAPESNLKVIVSSRPTHKLPLDLAPDHPLRDPSIVWQLEASAYAKAIQDTAERDLYELLGGDSKQEQVLGLLTVSHGGLTRHDLEELTDLAPFEIDHLLRGPCGRILIAHTIVVLGSAPSQGEFVYVFAHENLQRASEEQLGWRRLQVYRNALHEWAEKYRKMQWPVTTPRYLLTGYLRMLSYTMDTDRLVRNVRDSFLHDRLAELTGGDAALLALLNGVQQALVSKSDLTSLIRVTCILHHLAKRNANVPLTLSLAWAQLGRPLRGLSLARSYRNESITEHLLNQISVQMVARAESLISSSKGSEAHRVALAIPQPYRQAQMLSSVGLAIGKDNLSKGLEILGQAQVVACSIEDASQRGNAAGTALAFVTLLGERARAILALSRIVDPVARAIAYVSYAVATRINQTSSRDTPDLIGPIEQAVASTDDPKLQSACIAFLAAFFIEFHEPERASQLVTKITDANHRAQALGSLARERWQSNERKCATDAAEAAETASELIEDAQMRADALLEIARLWLELKQPERVPRAIDLIEQAIRSLEDPNVQGRMACEVAQVLLQARMHEKVETLSRDLVSPAFRARMLSYQLVTTPQARSIGKIVEEVQRAAELTTDPEGSIWALGALLSDLVSIGQHDVAYTVLPNMRDALAKCSDADVKVKRVAEITNALVSHGAYELADAVVGSLASQHVRVAASVSLSAVLKGAGAQQKAIEVATRAARIDRDDPNSGSTLEALVPLVSILIDLGERDSAVELAATIQELAAAAGRNSATRIFLKARCKVLAAKAWFEAGEKIRGVTALESAETTLFDCTNPRAAAEVLAMACQVAADADEHERAVAAALKSEAVARSGAGSFAQAEALTTVVRALIDRQDYLRAELVASAIARPGPRIKCLTLVARSLTRHLKIDEAQRVVQAAELALGLVPVRPDSDILAGIDGAWAASMTYRTAQFGMDEFKGYIDEVCHAWEAYLEVATVWLELGFHQRAVAIAQRVSRTDQRVEMLVTLMPLLSAAGQSTLAMEVGATAERAAATEEALESRLDALLSLGNAWAQLGYPAKAAELAQQVEAARESIEGPERRIHIVRDLVQMWASIAQRDRCSTLAQEAIDIALQIEDRKKLCDELRDIASLLLDISMFEHARSTIVLLRSAVDRIDTPVERANALISLVALLAKSGDHHAIPETVRGVLSCCAGSGSFDTNDMTSALESLLRSLVECGLIALAETVIQRLAKHEIESCARKSFAKALAANGSCEQALESASRIDDPESRADAYAAVAQSLASRGELRRATALVKCLEPIILQSGPGILPATTLASLSEVMAKAGEVMEATRLVAKAIVAPHWIRSLPVIARACPDIVDTIADDPQVLLMITDDATDLSVKITLGG